MRARSLPLAVAVGIDLALGEPPARWHPVTLAGRALALVAERQRAGSPRRQLLGGAAALAAVAGLAALGAMALESGVNRGFMGVVGRAAALKPLFAFRMLLCEGAAVERLLEAGDLEGARSRLRSLVSRPTADLPVPLVAAAAIESLAENLGDSILAPCLYYAGIGLPGAAVYRVVNTADSMYGYRDDRVCLGKAAARTDDVLSWLPSRLAAAAIVGAARVRLGQGAASRALATWLSDGPTTKSPNAGRPMAAMAGALGRRLEKSGDYVLGRDFEEPSAADVGRAVELTAVAGAITVGSLAGLLLVAGR